MLPPRGCGRLLDGIPEPQFHLSRQAGAKPPEGARPAPGPLRALRRRLAARPGCPRGWAPASSGAGERGPAASRPGPRREPALRGQPDLHRQGEGGQADEDRRERRGRDEPHALEAERHGNEEGGEIRAAPGRESARAGDPVPRVDEAARFGGGDGAMLGAVQAERPATKHPATTETIERTSASVLYGPERRPREAVQATPRGAPCARRAARCPCGRGGERARRRASRGRERAERCGRAATGSSRHGTARDAFTLGRGAPDAFADDRDPSGRAIPPRRGSEGEESAWSNCENRCVVHLDDAALGPFGKSRTARCMLRRPAEAAADEAEEGQHHDDDQDDPEDAQSSSLRGYVLFSHQVREGERLGRRRTSRPGAGAPQWPSL